MRIIILHQTTAASIDCPLSSNRQEHCSTPALYILQLCVAAYFANVSVVASAASLWCAVVLHKRTAVFRRRC
jgi:hypothetical protein